jgi:hypothetical protein
MNIDLKIKNIVLVGVFNPTLFDKYFFIKNEIINEKDILEGTFFGAIGGMQLICSNFNIIISVNQIIISSTKPEKDDDEISKIILLIINNCNFMTVSALGINLHWFMEDATQTIEKFSKEYFFNDKLRLFNDFFSSNDSRFGVYASTNFKDSRLKLDIKPNKVHDIFTNIDSDAQIFAFNFHFDIKDSSNNNEIVRYLADYNAYRKESERIISIYK